MIYDKNLRELEDILAKDRLPKEKQMELFAKMSADGISNEERIAIRNKLIESNISLAFFVLRKYVRYIQAREDDYSSDALLGLMNAVDNFDINAGFSFSTFCVRCVKNQILSTVVKEHRLHKRVKEGSESIYDNSENDGNEESLLDCLVDEQNVETEILDRVSVEEIRKLFIHLRPNERKIMQLLYSNDNNVSKVAKILGVSRQTVSAVSIGATHKIKNWFNTPSCYAEYLQHRRNIQLNKIILEEREFRAKIKEKSEMEKQLKQESEASKLAECKRSATRNTIMYADSGKEIYFAPRMRKLDADEVMFCQLKMEEESQPKN